MIQEEHFIIGIALVDADANLALAEEVLPVRRAHDGIHLGAHEGPCHNNTGLFGVIVRQIGREHTVHLAIFHRLQGGGSGGIDDSLKGRGGILQDPGSKFQIILQGAGQVPVLIRGAESQIVILETNADRAVSVEPFPLIHGEVKIGAGILQVFGGELLRIMLVLGLDPVQGDIQLGQEIGALFADGKEEIGAPDLPQRDGDIRISIGVKGDEGVYLPIAQLNERFRLGTVQIHNFGRDIMGFGPVQELSPLDAAPGDADLFPVQGGKIFGGNFFVIRGNIEVIQFLAHGNGGVEHILRPVLGVGNVAHQVDLAFLQQLEQFRPVAFNIFIFPAGVGGDFPLILIGVAGTAAEGILVIEGRVIPADADDFGAFLGRNHRRQKAQRYQRNAKKQDRCTFNHLWIPPYERGFPGAPNPLNPFGCKNARIQRGCIQYSIITDI